MSAARPYYLIGRSRLARLEENVHGALLPLVQRWWMRGEAIDIDMEPAAPGAAVDDLDYFAQRGDAWLAVRVDERNCLALAEGWLGCQVTARSELVRTLLKKFYGELFVALAGADDLAPSFESDMHGGARGQSLSAERVRPGAGALVLNATLNGCALTLFASAALWPELAETPAQSSQRPLTPCGAALGHSRLQIEAVLPAVRLPLAAIAALAPGDFLNLGHDLSGTLQLRGDGAGLKAQARVGRLSVRKAVQLMEENE